MRVKGETRMLGPIRTVAVPAMRAWVAAKYRELNQHPMPSDFAQTVVEGPDADRVLVFGSGPAVGWGVESQQLALPGNLGAVLSDLTARGVVVDIVADAELTIATSIAKLEELKLWRYEAIVILFGLGDVVDGTAKRAWQRDLRATISFVLNNTSRDSSVFLAGLQPQRTSATYDNWFGGLAASHIESMNTQTAEICATFDRVHFVPLSTAARPPAENYAAWGTELADSMFEAIEDHRVDRGAQLAFSAVTEDQRQKAVDDLGILDTPTEDRFDRIVTMARQLYGTDSAVFSIIDREREWHKSMAGTDTVEVARSSSFCSVTIRQTGAMVVTDATADERFSDNPSVTGNPGIRFYAGVPVEGPRGERIGALCVYDPRPRTGEEIDETMLRQLAHLIEAELRVAPAR